jgi:hypothetical protein
MKPKDVQRFFDSSVRKLKKIYGTEAFTVSVAAPTSWTYGNNMAVCLWKVDWEKCGFGSALAINAGHYAELIKKYKLDEEVGKISIANTACHEMAHHLAAFREVKAIRNTFIHEKVNMNMALRILVVENNELENMHGPVWESVMAEMGADHHSGKNGWRPVYEIPAIFNGRL